MAYRAVSRRSAGPGLTTAAVINDRPKSARTVESGFILRRFDWMQLNAGRDDCGSPHFGPRRIGTSLPCVGGRGGSGGPDLAKIGDFHKGRRRGLVEHFKTGAHESSQNSH